MRSVKSIFNGAVGKKFVGNEGGFQPQEKMVVGNGFEPLKALADRFTVCTL
jgi:hypothetical protein